MVREWSVQMCFFQQGFEGDAQTVSTGLIKQEVGRLITQEFSIFFFLVAHIMLPYVFTTGIIFERYPEKPQILSSNGCTGCRGDS